MKEHAESPVGDYDDDHAQVGVRQPGDERLEGREGVVGERRKVVHCGGCVHGCGRFVGIRLGVREV